MDRSSVVPRFLRGKAIRIHKGKRWKLLRVARWNCGFKFGDFAKTRRHIPYRTKASKKAMKKKLKGRDNTEVRSIIDPNVLKIRLIRTGEVKKKLSMFDSLDKNFVQGTYRSVSF